VAYDHILQPLQAGGELCHWQHVRLLQSIFSIQSDVFGPPYLAGLGRIRPELVASDVVAVELGDVSGIT